MCGCGVVCIAVIFLLLQEYFSNGWFSRYYPGTYMYRVKDRSVSALLQQPETTSPIFSLTRLRSRTCSAIVQCGTEAAVSGSRRRLAT